MPRKQRFKPTRKPKLTNEGAIERAPEQQNHTPNEEQMMSKVSSSPQDEERRSE